MDTQLKPDPDPAPEGNRIKVVFFGKFLPYETC